MEASWRGAAAVSRINWAWFLDSCTGNVITFAVSALGWLGLSILGS